MSLRYLLELNKKISERFMTASYKSRTQFLSGVQVKKCKKLVFTPPWITFLFDERKKDWEHSQPFRLHMIIYYLSQDVLLSSYPALLKVCRVANDQNDLQYRKTQKRNAVWNI